MDAATTRAAVKKYREYYTQKGIFESAVYPGVEQMLRTLTRRGFTLLVATSKPEIYARQVIGHFGLLPYFAYVAGSLPDESRSEKAEVIAWALSHAPGADPDRTVMVGDRWYDVAGAHQKSLACVGVLYGYSVPGELERAGADRVAADVPQLCRILCGKE